MLLTYYPPIKPYAQHRIAVDAPHNLYVEECGNPAGIPVVIVHGGPGTGSSEDNRRICDPDIYRIILFDQRGAGKSIPLAELSHNNTQALVQDMETIRNHLNIDRWVLIGGSWGSTLSLVYAETYPQHVLGLILRGIFLARTQDIEWIYKEGANRIFPDYWQEFVALIPENHRFNANLFYFDLMTSADETTRLAAAKAWASWEGRMLRLAEDKKADEKFINSATILGFSTISCYYMLNNCFLEPNQILRNIEKITDIPGIIVHGRYDVICLVENAWDLHKAWSKSELHLPIAGHASSEPGILDEIIKATQKMPRLIKKT